MRVQTLRLLDFRRFTDLTIDLTGNSRKVVALVGPNGSGKSSVFDAFEEVGSMMKNRPGRPDDYYRKSFHGEIPGAGNAYEFDRSVQLVTDPDERTRTSIYIRSAYRFTPELDIKQLREVPDVETDEKRPMSLIAADSRLVENYERLIGSFFREVYGNELTGAEWVERNIRAVNTVLSQVLDIQVSQLGNPVEGKGSLYFSKGTSTNFPYKNLSAGEKEVINLVLDLYVKRNVYRNSIICIDEPELHLSTAIQRKLLVELEKLVSDQSQLWVATHSIGFLRALQEELREKTTVIDFTGSNFDEVCVIRPVLGTRADWSRIFATALEDLTGLMAPRQIVYCEGRPDAGAAGQELGLDAEVYNAVFETSHPDTLFVSSGGGGEVGKNALVALRVLGKAFQGVALSLLKDRDELDDGERDAFLRADASRRMLTRREIENYLFDREVCERFCQSRHTAFDGARYARAVQDIQRQDLKLVQQEIQAACAFVGRVADFKRALASAVTPGTVAFSDIEQAIFP